MHLKTPFSFQVRYNEAKSNSAYSELLEELDLDNDSSLIFREVTVYNIDCILPYKTDDDSCWLKSGSENFVCKESYLEIKKQIEKCL